MAISLPTHRNRLPDTISASAHLPVPIGYTASGSGGINLALTFLLYMIAAGRGQRLQPPILVNYNFAEINRIFVYLSQRRRQVAAILPRHIHHNPEGFGGNPTAWKVEEGLIALDLEQTAERSAAYAQRIGARPGVFVEFLVPQAAMQSWVWCSIRRSQQRLSFPIVCTCRCVCSPMIRRNTAGCARIRGTAMSFPFPGFGGCGLTMQPRRMRSSMICSPLPLPALIPVAQAASLQAPFAKPLPAS
jgi:hypothetical protein